MLTWRLAPFALGLAPNALGMLLEDRDVLVQHGAPLRAAMCYRAWRAQPAGAWHLGWRARLMRRAAAMLGNMLGNQFGEEGFGVFGRGVVVGG